MSDGTFATALMQRSELKDDHVSVSFWAGFLTALALTGLLIVTARRHRKGLRVHRVSGVIAGRR